MDHAVDSFLETKLHRPAGREDWVRRDHLLKSMAQACERPVTLVAAPAGYGKTTLVAQWIEEARPLTAWVTLESDDNDPSQLWTHIATALERAGCPLPARPSRSTSPSGRPGAVLAAVVEGLQAMTDDVVLVLDDFHVVHDVVCHDQLEVLIEHLPAQAHLVMITRADPGLRLGRLRVSGELLELRADDLGFSLAEAATLLTLEHITLDDESLIQLMHRTEGWPAGLYLAILSLQGRADPAEFIRSFSGSNRFIGDYLTEEVLNRHPGQIRDFITTIAILDRFSAALCDEVADISGAAALLHDLEHANLFLVSLDDERRWYRFHPLFAAVARSELELSRPEVVPALHARAAAWFTAHGHVDDAIKHWIAAGRTDRAADLVQASWLRYVDDGRIATVRDWVDAIGRPGREAEPALSVTSAWLAALTGDAAALGGHLADLEELRDVGPLPDGARSVESAVSMIRGLFGYGGPVDMLAAAQRAVDLEDDPRSPFHSLATVGLGHAAYVTGDLDRAVTALGAARRNEHAPSIVQALALATESLVAWEQDDLARCREHADQAMWAVDAGGLRAVPQASMAFTALGLAQSSEGDLDGALATLARGLVLRRESTAHGPWGMIHHLIVTSRVAAQAGRDGLARELLAELDTRLAVFSEGMTAMQARTAAVRRLVHTTPASGLGGEQPLTEREVDLLRLLQGTLSLHEIAAQMYVSVNTAKTHTQAVYRKLGVHSRQDAVRAGRRHQLL